MNPADRFDPDRRPFPGAVRLRCTDHDQFVAWVNPPLPSPDVHVVCGSACYDNPPASPTTTGQENRHG